MRVTPLLGNSLRLVAIFVVVALVAVPATFSPTARAQGITSQQADAILEELKQIHLLLERQQLQQQAAAATGPQPNEKVSFSLPEDSYAIGREDAPLVLVEYTDYQCPFCRQFHITAYDELKKNYIDTGKIRFVTRDFPLEMHENAKRAAIAARCAGDQGHFWELRHVMIVNASQLKSDNIETYVRDLNLDLGKFDACMANDKYRLMVERELAEGQAIGVSATPSFVLGRLSGDKVDGVRLVGAMPYSVFDARIKEMLAASGGK